MLLYNYCVEVDELRVAQAERSLSNTAKEARSRSRSRKEEEEINLAAEGQLYGAGIAD